jgi:hypothetical protein
MSRRRSKMKKSVNTETGRRCPTNLPQSLWDKMLENEIIPDSKIELFRPLLSLLAKNAYKRYVETNIPKQIPNNIYKQ